MTHVQENRQNGTRAKWQKHISAWQQSGSSQRDYCRANGLALATFGYWRRKLKQDHGEKPRFYPLVVPAVEPSTKNNRLSQDSLRVMLGNDRFAIEIGESFSPVVLRKLITTLEQL